MGGRLDNEHAFQLFEIVSYLINVAQNSVDIRLRTAESSPLMHSESSMGI